VITKKKIIGIAAFVLFLILLPIGVKYTSVYYLTKAGAENVTIEDIDLNLFSGTLKIEKFSIKSQKHKPLTLSSALFNISMLRLFTGKVLVERAVIDGLNVVIENNPDAIVVGFPVLPKTEKEIPAEAEKPEDADEEKTIPFGIKNILISNSVVKYRDDKSASAIDISAIKLLDFYFWEKHTPAVLKIDALVNKAKLEADIVMKPFAETRTVESHIRLDQFKLGSFSGYLTDYVTDFQTIVSMDIKVSAKIDQSNNIELEQSGDLKINDIKGETLGLPVPVKIVNAAFSYDGSTIFKLASGQKFPVLNLDGTIVNNDFNVIVDNDKIEVDHDGLSWVGTIKNIEGIAEKTGITGNVVLDNFVVNGEDKKNHLFSLDKLTLNGINVAGVNKADLASVILSGIGVAKPVFNDGGKVQKGVLPLITESIALNKIQLADMEKLSVEAVEIVNVTAPLERNADRTLPVVVMVKKFTANLKTALAKIKTEKEKKTEPEVKDLPKAVPVETPPVETEKSRFIVKVGSLLFKGENIVKVKDSFVKPTINRKISLEKFTLTDISNENINDEAKIDVKIKTEKHALIYLKGNIQLFNPKVTLSMKANVQDVPLVELSPYSAAAVGYDIRTGVFNAKVDCKIVSNKLDVKNDLVVENIILVPHANGSAEKFAKKFLMPVDQTLSILRDENDNIILSFPVTGDVTDPSFHYRDLMRIAMQKAVRSASISILKNLIQPYGVVIDATEYVLAGKEYLQKIRLDPIEFKPGSPAIEKAGRDYLDTIVKLLNEKKELRLSACGFSAKSDVVGGDPINLPGPFVELARQRQNNIVYYLESKGISHKRLFHCNGDVDFDEDALPRVEMSL